MKAIPVTIVISLKGKENHIFCRTGIFLLRFGAPHEALLLTYAGRRHTGQAMKHRLTYDNNSFANCAAPESTNIASPLCYSLILKNPFFCPHIQIRRC
jgi:hypothetical protein